MDIQKVDIFAPYSHLSGWFTQKSADSVNTTGEIPGLNCGFNTSAGRAEVEQNRERLFEYLELNPGEAAFAGQIHGDHVQLVNKGGGYPNTDALVTSDRDITLAIQVADCAAVLLADPENHVIGAVHAGWRGTAGGIVPGTIKKMRNETPARPERMLAYISPCISLEYFEVGDEVAQRFPPAFVDRNSYRKAHVDLRGTLHRQLLEAGIPENQIEVDEGCTWQDQRSYFSYRREQDKAGRMLAIIALQSSAES